MEGYYWRLWDDASGRCIVALCGVCRDAAGGSWAVVALAAHPGGFVRWVAAPSASADASAFGAIAWDDERTLLHGSERRVAVDLGEGARLEAALDRRAVWPHRALGGIGLAQVAPGLPQYWHPTVLCARVRGSAQLDGQTISLDGWEGYVEKNWGGAFPGLWWWGQAGLGDGAMAAFAGGRLGGPLAASAVVVRVGDSVVRLAPPGGVVRAAAGGGEWRLRAWSARWAVTLEGEGAVPHILPVPVPLERRAVMRSEHHLAGRLGVTVRRGRRVVLRAESALAGQELGTPG